MMQQKFLCDQMLGFLARWLRILGYDTYFASDETTDERLLNIAQEEQRILVTRDKELIIRAKKRKLPTIPINTTDTDQQLQQLLPHLQQKHEELLSRCLLCNTKLVNIEKQKVKNKVPPKVFNQHNEFWYCSHCDKYYWQGSHYIDIMKRISNLK